MSEFRKPFYPESMRRTHASEAPIMMMANLIVGEEAVVVFEKAKKDGDLDLQVNAMNFIKACK